MSMTWSTLVEDLKNYSQRGSATADATVATEIPRIINREEVTLARELKVQGYQEVVTSTFDPLADGVLAKPTDWLNTISLNYNSDINGGIARKFLYPRSLEYIRMFWPDDTAQAAPKYYADYNDDNWLIGPSPDEAYEFQLVYYATLPLLTESNQTNWLTEKAPDLLLNACVVSLGRFLGWQPPKLAEFKEARVAAKGGVDMQDIQRVSDRATVRRGS